MLNILPPARWKGYNKFTVTFRKTPLVNGQIYHIFNRGIDGRITFQDSHEYSRFVQALGFYIYSTPPVKLSRFICLNDLSKEKLNDKPWGEKLVSVICYCVMPNHFHFMLKQEVDGGISGFMSQLLNSYTRYFNTKNDRIGQLFLDQFKNVLIENENQLLHISRYIHLNPFSSGVVNTLSELEKYKYSSFNEYIGKTKTSTFCETGIISSFFKKKELYKKFVFDNADYQRSLKLMRRLMVE